MGQPITVSAIVEGPIDRVWEFWTGPEHITRWNTAGGGWVCPRAVNDVRPGGSFSARMESGDGSEGFDFEGTYSQVDPPNRLEYTMSDGRNVVVTLEREGETTRVTETFDPDDVYPAELQQQGWQAILDNFAAYVKNGP